MKELQLLRTLYNPIQPTVGNDAEGVSYQELKPHPSLQHLIFSYWQLKTDHPLAQGFNYRVVADGCIDIFFDLNNTEESFVMGFCKEATEFPLSRSFNYIGIRFFPSIFPQLYKVSADELSNAQFELHSILPQLSTFLRNRISKELSFPELCSRLDTYFLGSSAAPLDLDSRFYNALGLILQNRGALQVEHQLQTGFSSRQLRRIFRHYIGASPKSFSKVVRFQHVLKASPSLPLEDIYELGFYDQAHFIKDFKNFYGRTPTGAFR